MKITQKSDKSKITEFMRWRSSELGHTALKSEVSASERRIIISAFGSWTGAVEASELEPANSHAQTALRISQRKSKKRTGQEEENTIWKK